MLISCGGASAERAVEPATSVVGAAMDFEAQLLGGRGWLRLSDLRGRVVLVDFWASWCGPCRESFPFYAELRASLPGDDFEIVAVSVDDDRGRAEEFILEMGGAFPAVWDAGQRIVAEWRAPVMPTAFLVDRHGVVRHLHRGFGPDAAAEITAATRALLQSRQSP